MSDKDYSITLNSTYEDSEKILDFVQNIQKKAGLSDDLTGQVMLLVSEAVTNAIEHGNKLDPEKKVDVSITVSENSVICRVADEGEGFNPNEKVENPLDEENLLKPSGRGVFLINEMADNLSYHDDGRLIEFEILF